MIGASLDDDQAWDATAEVMADAESMAAITESLASRARGESATPLETVREELARRSQPQVSGDVTR